MVGWWDDPSRGVTVVPAVGPLEAVIWGGKAYSREA